jgi:hypothetical protein
MMKLVGLTMAATLIGMMVVHSPMHAQDLSVPQPQEITSKQENLNNGGSNKVLAGAWNATVTMRVCQTGAAIRSFPAMYAFERGGTMHEFSTGNAPLGRSPAYGIWSHLSEQRFYASYQIFRFNADGSYAGRVKVRKYFDVDFLGQSFTATGTNEILDLNGNLIVTGCTTETGTRFEN